VDDAAGGVDVVIPASRTGDDEQRPTFHRRVRRFGA
jgi:hypothetical protein